VHEFKSKCLELIGIFFGSLCNVIYKVQKDKGVSVSQQIIENWLLVYKKENMLSLKKIYMKHNNTFFLDSHLLKKFFTDHTIDNIVYLRN